MAAAAILNLFESKIAPLDPPSPKTPPYNQTWSGSDDRFRRYGHLKFFQDGGGRHLGFVRTGNSAIRSAVHENPTLEPQHEVDRITRCRDMVIRICWGHMEPPFWGRGGRRGSAMAPLERAMVVSYMLSIVTGELGETGASWYTFSYSPKNELISCKQPNSNNIICSSSSYLTYKKSKLGTVPVNNFAIMFENNSVIMYQHAPVWGMLIQYPGQVDTQFWISYTCCHAQTMLHKPLTIISAIKNL